MKRVDSVWFIVISELFVNLAAAWFAAIIIVPNFAGFENPYNFLILLINFGAGIISLLIAFRLRKMSKRRKHG